MIIKDNLVSTFVVPLLKLNNKWLKTVAYGKRRLVNGYIYHEGVDNWPEDHLTLVITNYQNKDFKKEEDRLLSHSQCVGSYDIINSQYQCIVYNMSCYEDYYKFIEGRYSEYSTYGRHMCLDFPVVSDANVIAVQAIIDKSQSMKEKRAKEWNMTLEDIQDMELAPLWNSIPPNNESNILNKEVERILESSGKVNLQKYSTYKA